MRQKKKKETNSKPLVCKISNEKKKCWGLPGDPVVKNPPASAGVTGSITSPGRLDMLVGQLSPHAAAPEACTLQSLCSAMREATTLGSPDSTN